MLIWEKLLLSSGSGPRGQEEFTTPGTFSWVAPVGVTSVSVVCIAGGNGGGIGGGAGGGCAYINNLAVTPGTSYTVVVGAGGTGRGIGDNDQFGNKGGNSSFNGSTIVATSGDNTSTGTGTGGSYSGTGVSGYDGGITQTYLGYATIGGDAGTNADGEFQTTSFNTGGTGGSGSTGGAIGGAGNGGSGSGAYVGAPGGGAGGGSGLGYSGTSSNGANGVSPTGADGGAYGGGGGGANADVNHNGGQGGGGAVRIIWPGNIRAFPNTATRNV